MDDECGHVWTVVEVIADGHGAELAHQCVKCGAISYEASRAVERPPLGSGDVT